ncbi:hypothetical protein [Mucilaginibacter sp.]|uniref:hypothetical protein n=1 Tax=Mucilaginibacter sp. TaxID=1882438 RepID=UPI0025DC5252|nr:hypothetical protein [Mucilaginibacter sp.]
MEKLTRIEMKNIKGGVTAPGGPGGTGGTGGSGGGTAPVICNFTSTTCGNMCLNISTPATLPTVSSCVAYLGYLNPSCHFVAHTVTSCAAA